MQLKCKFFKFQPSRHYLNQFDRRFNLLSCFFIRVHVFPYVGPFRCNILELEPFWTYWTLNCNYVMQSAQPLPYFWPIFSCRPAMRLCLSVRLLALIRHARVEKWTFMTLCVCVCFPCGGGGCNCRGVSPLPIHIVTSGLHVFFVSMLGLKCNWYVGPCGSMIPLGPWS